MPLFRISVSPFRSGRSQAAADTDRFVALKGRKVSRTLIVAAGAIEIAFAMASPAAAQNLDAGKSPSQIFASTCAACHRGSRGLVKTVSPGSLPGFLREHYTTSTNMAGALSSFLLAGSSGPAGVIPQRPTAGNDEPPRPGGSVAEGGTPPEIAQAGRRQKQ